MADYSSSTQRKITQQIDIEFRLDVQEAKKLAIEGRKSSKASQEGIKAIEASIAKVNRALEKAQRSTGKRNKTEKEQIAFENQKRKNIDKLKRKYKELTTSLNALYAVEAKREITSRKQAALDEKKAKDSTFSGGFKRGVRGGTNNFIGGIGTSLGTLTRYIAGGAIIRGIIAIGNAFRTTIKLGVEFESKLADLAAVAGVSTKEVEELGKAAFDLAGSTKFSVDQIVGLQKELAKLGFSKDEILSTQGAVAGLAQATGESLSTAAQLTGKTLRAFNLETTSASRVANVLTTSVNETALNLETLATALQYVSPIASTFGISLEETNAAIGLLANNGFTASRAGTGLRQVLLTLGQSGKTLAEVLEETATAGLGVTDAVELVGKRGAPALLALLDNIDEVKRLTEEAKEPFTALVAEAKQLSTTAAAFENAGVALNTVWTSLGRTISEGLDFKGLGLVLLDVATGFGDLTAEIQALQPVVAGLDESTLKFFAQEETSQEQIRENLAAILLEKERSNEISYQSYVLAKDALDVTAQRLFNEKEINKAVRERQDLLDDANDKEIKRIKDQFKSGDFEGAEKSIDIADDAAKRNIASLERQRDALKKNIEQLGDDTSEEARLALDIKLAEYNAEIEAEKQFRQQLLDILTDYETKASVLNNDALKANIKNAEKKKKTYEKILANGGLSSKQLAELRERLQEEQDLIDAYQAELSFRGVEEDKKKKEQKEQEKTFKSIADAEFERNKLREQQAAGQAIDERRLKQLDEFVEKEIGLLGDLTDAYVAFRDFYAISKIEEGLGFPAIDDKDTLSLIGAAAKRGKSGATASERIQNLKVAIADIKKLQQELGTGSGFDRSDKIIEGLENQILAEEKKIEQANKQGLRLLGGVGKDVADAALTALNNRYDAELASVQARYDAENDILKGSLEQGLITQEQYEQQRELLERKRIDKVNAIEKKKFRAEKAQRLAEVAINTASALARIPADVGPLLGAVLAPAIIAGGALQAGVIAGQKFQPVQYADGGWINGPSHSAGGVPFTVNGVGGFEAEGGEYIINKRAMANPQVAATAQALNSMGKRSVVTGNRIFEDGGATPNAVAEAALMAAQKPIRAYLSEKEEMERSNVRVRTDERSTL
jgi:hypothetical protein